VCDLAGFLFFCKPSKLTIRSEHQVISSIAEVMRFRQLQELSFASFSELMLPGIFRGEDCATGIAWMVRKVWLLSKEPYLPE
jgi:hypothetical protein